MALYVEGEEILIYRSLIASWVPAIVLCKYCDEWELVLDSKQQTVLVVNSDDYLVVSYYINGIKLWKIINQQSKIIKKKL